MTTDHHWQQQYLKTGDYLHEISRGNVRGAYPFSAYGRVTLGGAQQGTLVRSQDGNILNVPQSVQMSVVSTSNSDSAAGIGVQSVVIEYLNGNLEYSYEVVIMNGTTPVNTIATDIRWIQVVHMATFGTNQKAVGAITVNYGAEVHALINIGGRSSGSSFRRIPAGKTFYITTMYSGSTSGTATARVDITLVSTHIDGIDNQETGVFFPHAGTAIQDGNANITMGVPFPISEGHIVGFVAGCDKAASVVAGYMGWIE